MNVYPNPFANQFALEYTFNAGDQIVLLDIHGKQVFTETLKSFSESVLIQTNNLSKGMYVLQVNTKQGVLSKKILKMY
ncbi:MAG: T9SS type A sorting domain-containing protein [Bacteroidia bacterium]